MFCVLLLCVLRLLLLLFLFFFFFLLLLLLELILFSFRVAVSAVIEPCLTCYNSFSCTSFIVLCSQQTNNDDDDDDDDDVDDDDDDDDNDDDDDDNNDDDDDDDDDDNDDDNDKELMFSTTLLVTVSDEIRERVIREVRVMASLNHPNIVRYYDSWFDEMVPDHVDMNMLPIGESTASDSSVAGTLLCRLGPSHSTVLSQPNSTAACQTTDKVIYLYIRMELCRVDTLKDWLDQHRDRRPVEKCVEIFESVVIAINYLHEQNFMHRDIKVMPHNFSHI